MAETVEIEGAECIHQSDKAILVEVGLDKPVWIPHGQVDDDSEVWEKGQKGKLVITEWIATQKGLT
jgi:hypothetical protein